MTGVSLGAVSVTYTLPTGCFKTKTVTVNPLPNAGTITGLDSVCVGAHLTLTDTFAAGTGTWHSLDITKATNIGRVVTGVAYGLDSISYAVTNGCGTNTAFKAVYVKAAPNAGAITGLSSVCVSSAITLSDTVTLGTWGATNADATVSGVVVTGNVAGIDTITFTNTNSCGTAIAKAVITVVTLPNSGAITGQDSVCPGAVVTLGDATAVGTGTWSASNSNATVSVSGVVNGLFAGVDTITYTASNVCGTVSATRMVTVLPAPIGGIISGTDSICAGTSFLFSETVPGGSWSSVNGAIATISGTGLVTGLGLAEAGLDTILYSATGSCGTAFAMGYVFIKQLAVAGTISGNDSVCTGTTIVLTASATGGTWSIANANASLSLDTVRGVTAGIDTVFYTAMNSCDTQVAYKKITVKPQPNAGAITGTDSVCMGATVTLADAASGGTWTITNTNAAVLGGVVMGTLAGRDTVIYAVTNYCGTAAAYKAIKINPSATVSPITGGDSLCLGTTLTLADATTGGLWTATNGVVAVLSGVVHSGLGLGVDTIGYNYTNSCGSATATKVVTVLPAPDAGSISGASHVCIGNAISLLPTVAGGSWASANTAIASVAGGLVTGVSIGLDSIQYTVTNTCGSATTAYGVVVDGVVKPTIFGGNRVCISEKADTLNYTPDGGVWSASNGSATVAGGVVSGVAAGVDTIHYTITNTCGTYDTSMQVVVYTKAQCDSMNGVRILPGNDDGVRVYPNPATGMFTLAMDGKADNVEVTIVDMYGKVQYTKTEGIELPAKLQISTRGYAAGTYMVNVIMDGFIYRQKLVIVNDK